MKEQCAFNENLICRERKHPLDLKRCLLCLNLRSDHVIRMAIQTLVDENPNMPYSTHFRLRVQWDAYEEIKQALINYAKRTANPKIVKRLEHIENDEHIAPTLE